MRSLPLFALALFFSPSLAAAQTIIMEPGPKSAEDSLKCIKVRPGFKVELMAAEPVVTSPIAFAWGADGKFWVVEMGDYPLGLDNKNKPGGKIKFLEKTKPDGPYDKATVFLDNLSFPTGVTPWGKGVIVTCAPDIFYAEDTDGDGKADKKTVLFTGFKEGNPQHRVNGLVYGLDNWLYGANGDSGGKILSIKTAKEVSISGRDFRIKPDEGLIEPVSGSTQFGRARDDWGNWFGNNNTNPMYHFVLEDRYLKRNPNVIYPDVKVQVSETPGAAQVYPISKALPRFNSPQGLNHFTSACSAIVYRDDLFGPDFASNTFVSEPVHNLIHREIMTPKGVTFTSKRAADEQTSEFLASTDNWFRPTTIQTGPDGALWIADMYRYVIEHPEWIPKTWQNKLDLRAGQDKGRIYRVYPEAKKPRAIPNLEKLKDEELVKALDSPSGWQRDTAQKFLITRLDQGDGSLVELLQKIAKESANPLARAHSFAALSGFTVTTKNIGQLGDVSKSKKAMTDIFYDLLIDKDARLRTLACQIGGQILLEGTSGGFRLRQIPSKAFLEILSGEKPTSLIQDPDQNVRMQLAYSLGHSENPNAGEFLGKLFLTSLDDPYMTAAVFSSLNKKNWAPFFANIQGKESFPVYIFANLLRLVTVFGSPEDKVFFLAHRIDQNKDKAKWQQLDMIAKLMESLESGNIPFAKLLESIENKENLVHVAKIKEVFQVARTIVSDPKASVSEKMLALRILGRENDLWDEDRKTLVSFLSPQVEEDLQMAAAQSLGKISDPRIPADLLKPWKGYSPALRTHVMGVLLSRQIWTRPILEALENKQILPSELDAIRRQQLLQNKDREMREWAEKLLAAASNPDRDKVVMQYILTIPSKGDAKIGKNIFTKHCAACHQLAGVGQQVGPDLASVPDKSLEGLLTAILDPNRVVEARYVNYLATTKAGQTLSGVLLGETSTSITLVAADGKKHELLRRDLEELASTGKSPMPEGLEKDIPLKDMADLLEFLRAGIPSAKPKEFEGNKPEVVKPDAKGMIKLLPQNGAIYGKNLILEKKHGNLGYWSSEDDHVIWTMDVPKAGAYAVEFEWACADSSAGNTFVLKTGAKKLTMKVAGTGTWDDYQVHWIGTMQLPQGRVEITMRSQGPIRGALMDLKGVYLTPK